MEEAKIRETNETITAEDLWYMDNVNSFTYQCIYCSMLCSPCSFVKDVNERRPHFRMKSGHIDGCDFLQYEKTRKNEPKRKVIRSEDGKIGRYPSEFSFPTSQPQPAANTPLHGVPDDPEIAEDPKPQDNDKGMNNPPKRDRPYKTNSFRLLVKHYLNFPYDRDLPLNAESIQGSTYRSCFQSLFTNEYHPLIKPENKIYQGSIAWNKPSFENDNLAIPLNEFTIDENKNRQNLVLKVDMSDWSERTKSAFYYDLEKSRTEIIDAKGEKKLLVFFVGVQDTNAPLNFHVNSHSLISLNLVYTTNN